MSIGPYIKPHFLIIGEQKCGTTSLYRYLMEHPQILPSKLKEPQLFHQSIEKIEAGLEAYWSLFPTQDYQGNITIRWPRLGADDKMFHEILHFSRVPGKKYITGEASANTFREADPNVLHRFLPDLRLILLLRNPITRAHSFYRMHLRLIEEGILQGEKKKKDFESEIMEELRNGGGAYLNSGIYFNKLDAWVNVYGWNNLKVYLSEDLQNQSKLEGIMNELHKYLGLEEYNYGNFLENRFNRASEMDISQKIREAMAEFYKPHNEKLQNYLQRKLPWV